MTPVPNDTSRRTRPTRQQTRTQILDAALQVFGERGIAPSTLSEVAAAAGLTKGAVYSSFDSKDDLVLALMEEHVMQRLTASLDSVSASADPHHIIANVAHVLVREMQADAAWHRLLAEYFAMAYRDERIRDALRQRRREARQAVARALRRLVDLLEVEFPLPIDEMVVVLFALSNGLAIESGIDPDGVPDHLMAEVLTLLSPDAITKLGRTQDANHFAEASTGVADT